MLTGAQLSIAIAAVLAGAVALGWILHWLWTRLARKAIGSAARIREMIERQHEAEQAKAEADEARELAENLLAEREAEMESRMNAMQARLDGALEGREAKLAASLREAQAETEAVMDGLRNARARIDELEQELGTLRGDQNGET